MRCGDETSIDDRGFVSFDNRRISPRTLPRCVGTQAFGENKKMKTPATLQGWELWQRQLKKQKKEIEQGISKHWARADANAIDHLGTKWVMRHHVENGNAQRKLRRIIRQLKQNAAYLAQAYSLKTYVRRADVGECVMCGVKDCEHLIPKPPIILDIETCMLGYKVTEQRNPHACADFPNCEPFCTVCDIEKYNEFEKNKMESK